MILIPFGEVKEDRVKISKDYKLIEQVGGIWRLTTKCKDNYQPESYVLYLRGNLEKPLKLSEKPKPVVKPVVKKITPQEEIRTPEYQKALDDIFNL